MERGGNTTLFIQLHGCGPIYIQNLTMGLHYLTFMGRSLENGKKLLLVQVMNSADWIINNVVNWISIFNEVANYD